MSNDISAFLNCGHLAEYALEAVAMNHNHSGRNHNRSAFLAAVLARAFPDAPPISIERAVFEMQRAARRAQGGNYNIPDADGAGRCALRSVRALGVSDLNPGAMRLEFTPDGETVLSVPGAVGELPCGGFAVYR